MVFYRSIMMICLLEMVIEGIVSGNEPVLDQNFSSYRMLCDFLHLYGTVNGK